VPRLDAALGVDSDKLGLLAQDDRLCEKWVSSSSAVAMLAELRRSGGRGKYINRSLESMLSGWRHTGY